MTAGALHPWNTSFEWRRLGIEPRRLTSDQVESFHRTGWLVVEDLFEQAMVTDLTADLDTIEEEGRGVRPRPAGLTARDLRIGRDHLCTTPGARAPLRRAGSANRRRSPTSATICSASTSACTGTNSSTNILISHGSSRGIRTTDTHTWTRSNTSRSGWRSPTQLSTTAAPGSHRQRTPAAPSHTRYVHPLGLSCFDDHPDATAAPVRAGGAVVFSSLTPHRTGPNTTDSTRKTYILQYAPDGAEVLHGDPAVGPPTDRATQDDPARQYEVLRNGAPIGVAE